MKTMLRAVFLTCLLPSMAIANTVTFDKPRGNAISARLLDSTDYAQGVWREDGFDVTWIAETLGRNLVGSINTISDASGIFMHDDTFPIDGGPFVVSLGFQRTDGAAFSATGFEVLRASNNILYSLVFYSEGAPPGPPALKQPVELFDGNILVGATTEAGDLVTGRFSSGLNARVLASEGFGELIGIGDGFVDLGPEFSNITSLRVDLGSLGGGNASLFSDIPAGYYDAFSTSWPQYEEGNFAAEFEKAITRGAGLTDTLIAPVDQLFKVGLEQCIRSGQRVYDCSFEGFGRFGVDERLGVSNWTSTVTFGDFVFASASPTVAPVPIPVPAAMLLGGLAALGALRHVSGRRTSAHSGKPPRPGSAGAL